MSENYSAELGITTLLISPMNPGSVVNCCFPWAYKASVQAHVVIRQCMPRIGLVYWSSAA